jgi:hypothetical protein
MCFLASLAASGLLTETITKDKGGESTGRAWLGAHQGECMMDEERKWIVGID